MGKALSHKLEVGNMVFASYDTLVTECDIDVDVDYGNTWRSSINGKRWLCIGAVSYIDLR